MWASFGGEFGHEKRQGSGMGEKSTFDFTTGWELAKYGRYVRLRRV
jgi:hypothetical protein